MSQYVTLGFGYLVVEFVKCEHRGRKRTDAVNEPVCSSLARREKKQCVCENVRRGENQADHLE